MAKDKKEVPVETVPVVVEAPVVETVVHEANKPVPLVKPAY